MPVCPYENHRLRLDERGHCERCGGDLRAYAALRPIAAALFNEARGCVDRSDLDAAVPLLNAAIRVHAPLAEAHWLLGLIERRRGADERASEHLARARSLGAPVDPGPAVDAGSPPI
jgi:hypothetical protein